MTIKTLGFVEDVEPQKGEWRKNADENKNKNKERRDTFLMANPLEYPCVYGVENYRPYRREQDLGEKGQEDGECQQKSGTEKDEEKTALEFLFFHCFHCSTSLLLCFSSL